MKEIKNFAVKTTEDVEILQWHNHTEYRFKSGKVQTEALEEAFEEELEELQDLQVEVQDLKYEPLEITNPFYSVSFETGYVTREVVIELSLDYKTAHIYLDEEETLELIEALQSNLRKLKEKTQESA